MTKRSCQCRHDPYVSTMLCRQHRKRLDSVKTGFLNIIRGQNSELGQLFLSAIGLNFSTKFNIFSNHVIMNENFPRDLGTLRFLDKSMTLKFICLLFNQNLCCGYSKLEDLKVLRRSPDLLNNVKIGQGQLLLIMEQILFYHICCRHFGQVT